MNPWTKTRIDLFAFFAFNTIIQPVYVLYLVQAGYSATEIALVHMVKEVAVLILQIPSGVLSDLFRYKHSLVVATILYLFAMAGFLVVGNPILVGLAFFCWGAALAFLNGADEGYLYRVSPSQEIYVGTTVRYGIVIRLGWFVTWAIGSLIYALYAVALFVVSVALACVGLGTAIILPRDQKTSDKSGEPEAAKFSISSGDVLFLLPYALFCGAMQIMMIYQQVKLFQDGLPVETMGIVFNVFLVGGMVGSYLYKHFHWSSYRAVLLFSNLALPATFILLGFHLPALALVGAMTAQSCVNGLMRPANSLEVNRTYKGQGVASLFSVQTFLASVLKLPLLGLFGFVVDRMSLEAAFQLLIIPCVISIAMLFLMKFKAPSSPVRQIA